MEPVAPIVLEKGTLMIAIILSFALKKVSPQQNGIRAIVFMIFYFWIDQKSGL